jgi:zinc D-Ala-D-Ala carboxypeptidase
MSNNYTPRREQNTRPPKKSGGGKTAVVVLVVVAILVVAGVVAFPHVLPLLQSHPQVASSTTSSSSEVVSTDDEAEDTSSAESSADASSAAETITAEAEQTSSYVVDGVDLAILVNSTHPLPDGYDIPLTTLDNGQQVATVMVDDLQQMLQDAQAQGVYGVVASGFRTAEKQQSLMDEKVQSFVNQGMSQSDAETEALKWVNAVGCSEHQSGLAVDINADGVHSAGYEVYAWLAENAWQYGFILRYPEGKTDITGTDYEAWHYRYVGKELAADIYQLGVCLEEYLGA